MRSYIRSEIVCLVIVTLTSFQNVNAQSRCINPNSKRGVCTSIYDCPALYNVINKPNISDDDRKFLKESACIGGKGTLPHVCCNEDSEYDTKPSDNGGETTIQPILPSNGKGNVLPSPPYCGLEGTGKKIYNGNNTGLDEYAWMVILEYRKGNGPTEQKCAGSLINQRYVLTAAHCLTGEVITLYGNLVSVRLGEYDTSTSRDCIENDCSDPILTVRPEEIIPHENYAPQSNDIGLIRLGQDAPLTRYIRPVCLPSTIGAARSLPGQELVVAGWGRTLTSRTSNIKQKLYVPVADQAVCAAKYAKLSKITDGELCAGGRFGEDSCGGDSGGPLMAMHNNYWFIEGVVSYGLKCGLQDLPAVYTRVSAYDDWIKSHMKP